MKLGVFGGSFDPVHFGHLLLAECCREQAGLDQVWFVPAAQPPHKLDRQLSAPEYRTAMLELAIGGHEAFRLSRIEIERGSVSYTVETLAEIHVREPNAELFLLMGGDSLADLPTWREPGRICELATPLVVHRTGATAPDFKSLAAWLPPQRVSEIERLAVVMPPIGISSSDCRARVAAGKSIRYRLPRPVEVYIQMAGLYRSPKPAAE